MHGLDFDIAHLLAGGLVLVSFMMLYQDRLYALINVFALQAVVLALSVAWQAWSKTRRISTSPPRSRSVFKAIVIPVALRRMVVRLGIHREIETVVGVGPTMLAGIALVALSMVVMLPVTARRRSAGARGSRLRPLGGAARPFDDGDAAQRGQPGGRLHVAGERPDPGRHRRARACRWWWRSASPFRSSSPSSSSASSCSASANASTRSTSQALDRFREEQQ